MAFSMKAFISEISAMIRKLLIAMNNTNKKSHFDIKTARNLIPGMYESAIFLHELLQYKSHKLAERQKQGTQFLLREDQTVLGTLASFLYLCGHTTEYLLKIRIQLETKSFPKIHNLT